MPIRPFWEEAPPGWSLIKRLQKAQLEAGEGEGGEPPIEPPPEPQIPLWQRITGITPSSPFVRAGREFGRTFKMGREVAGSPWARQEFEEEMGPPAGTAEAVGRLGAEFISPIPASPTELREMP